jgi:hypothetical protein
MVACNATRGLGFRGVKLFSGLFGTFPERSGLEDFGVPGDSLFVLWLLNIFP